MDQEATVRSLQGTTDWFKIGKGVQQGCILSPYFSYVQSTSCDMPGWKNHNLESRFPGDISTTSLDDTTLMAKSEEELKSLSMRVKEDSKKAGLKFNILKTKIMASNSIASWKTDGKKVKTVTNFLCFGSKITTDGECSHEMKRCLLLGRKVMSNIDGILKSSHHFANKCLL